jgi:hypothetical protein
MDLNQLNGDEPRVFLFDHTWCSYDDEQRVVKCISIPAAIRREYRAAGKPLTLSYELIDRCAPEIAPTFSEFLRKLADGEYEDVEAFLE